MKRLLGRGRNIHPNRRREFGSWTIATNFNRASVSPWCLRLWYGVEDICPQIIKSVSSLLFLQNIN